MLGVPLDEGANGDDGVDGATEGEEAGGIGELVGTGDLGDENVGVLNATLLQTLLDTIDEGGDVILVPAGADYSDAGLGAVKRGECKVLVGVDGSELEGRGEGRGKGEEEG